MNWFSRFAPSEASPQTPELGNGIEVEMADLLACQPLGQLLPLRSDPRRVGRRHGQYLSRMKGRGMEFSEVRAYQQGDDIRAIDWRVTARTGKTHTRLYQEERERPVFLFLDLSASMRFGSSLYLKSTQASYLAAALAWSAFKGGDRIGVVCLTPTGTFEVAAKPRRQGLTQVLEVIEQSHRQHLAAQSHGEPPSFSEALEHLRRHAHTGSLIALISDFQAMDADAEQALTLLSRHNELMSFTLEDPLEQQLAQQCQSDLSITDGQNSGVLQLSSRKVREAYQQRLSEQQAYSHKVLGQLSRHQYRLSAARSIQQQLEGGVL